MSCDDRVHRRPRRSILWVPGDQLSKLEKAAKSNADVVVLDLEDGVSVDRKAVARDCIAGALRDLDFGKTERMVRVSPGPEVAADVSAATSADSLCFPKLGSASELTLFQTLVERTVGRTLPILAISGETPLGLLNVQSLAGQTSGVVAWMWGSEDLASALGCHARQMGEPFEGPLAWARNVTVLLAVATGAQAIDTVYPFYRDTKGLLVESETAARAGFSGKGLIHPSQVAPVNEIFTPSPAEVERALAVVEAFDEGQGVAVLDGQMLDMPHLAAARRVLERAGRSQ
jgi:citrate lyase subunit beta / citryl-CoA lyase